MMPNVSKHEIIGKYFLKHKCEKFQKSAKMLIKCRKFSWARWYRTHGTKQSKTVVKSKKKLNMRYVRGRICILTSHNPRMLSKIPWLDGNMWHYTHHFIFHNPSLWSEISAKMPLTNTIMSHPVMTFTVSKYSKITFRWYPYHILPKKVSDMMPSVPCESTDKMHPNDTHIIYYQKRQWDMMPSFP